MSGNEILLNLRNCKYFNMIEIFAAMMELGKRLDLEVNKDLSIKQSNKGNYDFLKHEYVYNALQRLVDGIGGMNVITYF